MLDDLDLITNTIRQVIKLTNLMDRFLVWETQLRIINGLIRNYASLIPMDSIF
jgi:hypothetical protein